MARGKDSLDTASRNKKATIGRINRSLYFEVELSNLNCFSLLHETQEVIKITPFCTQHVPFNLLKL